MLYVYLLVFSVSGVTCSEVLSRQRRTWIIDSFSIEEGHPGPFPYVLGQINIEREYRVYFELYGEGVDEEPKGVLSIDRATGAVSVHKALDYEEKKVLKLKFEAKKTDLSLDTKLGVEISILDINDNPPSFQRDLYEVSIREEDEQGSYLLSVLAHDRDKAGTPNSTFHHEIKSVSPNPPDAEFFINDLGVISFKGCLDYEVGETYTVVVEAKDHGEVVSLSSSATVLIHVQDGNNHLPSISGQTGTGKVREGEAGLSPVRLHVTDGDTLNTSAWRAKYFIHGDEGGHFKIETDPETNDGILTVVKPLDYEKGAERELSISVENEVPYFSCKVKEKTSSGLWTVDTSGGEADSGQLQSVNLIIQVEDTNDPPAFKVTVKEAKVEENAPIGTWVETVTAVDPDTGHNTTFVYMIGDDPEGWVTVDPETGRITTVKPPDRESPSVVNGVYTIILHAVDNGEPPMTGTATMLIHVKDQNDNVPQLTVDHVNVCVSEGASTTSITAFDLDDEPFTGPFRFELLGEAKEKWRLNTSYGYTVDLMKEPSVYAGPHTVELKISDMQSQFAFYNLSVTVCDCSVTPNCGSDRAVVTKMGFGAMGIVFATLFILLFLLLLGITISCQKEFATLQSDIISGETLLKSNTEEPGSDCNVPDIIPTMLTGKEQKDLSNWHSYGEAMQQTQHSTKVTEQTFSHHDVTGQRRENLSYLFNSNTLRKMTSQSVVGNGYHLNQVHTRSTIHSLHKNNSSLVSNATVLSLLHRKLSSLHATDEELGDYRPHLYADEGDSDTVSELEHISIPDENLSPSALQDLGPKFNQLALVCKEQQIQN